MSNLRAYLEHSDLGDLLASIHMPGPVANFDPGGSGTGVLERWEQKKIVVKKFIDNVSGAEKLHCNDVYESKVENMTEEV